MQSMTGFGQGAAQDGRGALSVQIAAVNHRSCQVQVKSDLRDLAADELVRSEVRRALERGAITVQVRAHAGVDGILDRERLIATWRGLAAVARELGAPVPALEQVAALLPSAGLEAGPAEELLRPALDQALAALVGERRREGEALAAAFRDQAGQLRRLLPSLHQLAAARAVSWREHLTRRLGEILRSGPLPEEVLVRELALHCERVDVTEELVRLGAHLAALESLVAEPERAGPDAGQGRRLEFLLQELGREISTTGAKSNDTALTALVLEAKALIEQMKEQAANVL